MVEGWHPSQPERVGYNLLLDGTWLGTFETLDSAAAAASAARPHSEGRAPVRLSLEHAPQRRSDRPRLHIVDPVPDDD